MIRAVKTHSAETQAGFTLLEMLVAVTLVAIMAITLWAVFRISIRSWSLGTGFIDANQRHRSILNLVRKQMASAYGLLAINDALPAGPGALVFSGTEDSLQFISLNSLQFQESPGLTLVSYEVDTGPDGNYALMEREARYIGRMPAEGIPFAASKVIPIFENLSSCLFEYLDPGNADNAAQWVREWDGQTLGKLPLAVSFTMVSRDPKGDTLNRHMVVPVKSEPYDWRVNFNNPFAGRGM